VRTRLAALYALLFLVAGLALLALTYGLLASRLPAPRYAGKALANRNPKLAALCKQGPPQVPPVGQKAPPKGPPTVAQKFQPTGLSDAVLQQCKLAFAAGARAGSQNQRDQTLNSLLDIALVGLAAATLASAGIGWLIAGRAMRPVRSITETARRASELQLGERLALSGPDDELKELADTFDRMLERLDAAFASRQRFVANAAHELRTPLTAMRTAIEVTLSKPNRTPEQLEAMALRVVRSVERAQAIVEALLTLATSEAGPAAEEPVDLATAAEDALDAAAAEIAARGIRVEPDLKPASAQGDRVLVERMIANLVDNAVRHNTDGGWISVRTIQQPDAAIFHIANTGPEVAQEAIPALFEPFGRAELRLNPTEGVGLGLSIARAISQAHGAKITATSRPGGGLQLWVMFPSPSPLASSN
jgi:signal transduction histidine kinase